MTPIKKQNKVILWAFLAAFLFGMSMPFSKQLLQGIQPLMLAAFLYLGAGIGMLFMDCGRSILKIPRSEARLTKGELPFVILMILLDIAAPIFLMLGLSRTTSANASLLGNFEIVATSMIALVLFKEAIGKRQWIAIILIALSSILLSIDDYTAFSFSNGSLFVLLACACWGLENNCTKNISLKDPTQIVIIKGLGSGFGSLSIALVVGQSFPSMRYLFYTMLLGFVAYGLSIYFYVKAQRELGAARTSAYYAVAPFIGVIIAVVAFGENISLSFVLAAAIMIAGTWFSVSEKHIHDHCHHTVHHEHQHRHDDGHHVHEHENALECSHTHLHVHEELTHAHDHKPDMHHHHGHSNS